MKMWSLVLALCLLLSGCQFVHQEGGIPEGAFSEGYQGAADRSERVVLYNGVAYYECDPFERSPWQPHIYSLKIGDGTEATDLLRGELVALCGSVLIGKTSRYYCAMDLDSSKPQWVNLQSATDEGVYFEYQDKVYLFSQQGEKNYVDTIELSNLKATRISITPEVTQTILKNDKLYYIASVDGNWGFYQCDLQTQQAVLLCEVSAGTALDFVGNRFLLSHSNENARIYDLKSGELFVPEDFIAGRILYPTIIDVSYAVYAAEGILIVRTRDPEEAEADVDGYRKRYYEIATWKEIPNFSERYAISNEQTYQNGDVAYEDGAVYYYNGEWYKDRGDSWALDHTGWAHVQDTCIETVSFKNSKKNQLIHYEQKVLTE